MVSGADFCFFIFFAVLSESDRAFLSESANASARFAESFCAAVSLGFRTDQVVRLVEAYTGFVGAAAAGAFFGGAAAVVGVGVDFVVVEGVAELDPAFAPAAVIATAEPAATAAPRFELLSARAAVLSTLAESA